MFIIILSCFYPVHCRTLTTHLSNYLIQIQQKQLLALNQMINLISRVLTNNVHSKADKQNKQPFLSFFVNSSNHSQGPSINDVTKNQTISEPHIRMGKGGVKHFVKVWCLIRLERVTEGEGVQKVGKLHNVIYEKTLN